MINQQIQERRDKFTEFLLMNLEYEEKVLNRIKKREFGKITKKYKIQSEVIEDLKNRLNSRQGNSLTTK